MNQSIVDIEEFVILEKESQKLIERKIEDIDL